MNECKHEWEFCHTHYNCVKCWDEKPLIEIWEELQAANERKLEKDLAIATLRAQLVTANNNTFRKNQQVVSLQKRVEELEEGLRKIIGTHPSRGYDALKIAKNILNQE